MTDKTHKECPICLGTGCRMGWLNQGKYSDVAKKAWLALVEKLNTNGELENVCVDTKE